MNCLEFRREKLSDPNSRNEELSAHGAECASCRTFESSLHGLDDGIRDALDVKVPEGLAARVLLNQSLQPRRRLTTVRPRWIGVAAAVVLSAVISLALFTGPPQPDLNRRLIAHVQHEHPAPDALMLSQAHLQQVLYSVGAESEALPGRVLYATSCIIEGQLVAHLIVRHGDAEYVLILVPGEPASHESTLQTASWKGLVEPHPLGNLALLEASTASTNELHTAQMRQIVQQYGNAIRSRTI